ncbi:hypothetical protein OEM_07050 [Mycobacterium intracellulare subsp. yongonense 05-1390]|nr:hypothetical protein OEM_07050 [Mycobacterium intracellulare subsp. yongonense 05-1390]ETZ33637.1 hypothetical protein L842_0833 [Mycobacterium intracellulare MIN_052511_1280]
MVITINHLTRRLHGRSPIASRPRGRCWRAVDDYGGLGRH